MPSCALLKRSSHLKSSLARILEPLERRDLLTSLFDSGSFLPTHADPFIPNFVEGTTFQSSCSSSCFWDETSSWSSNSVPKSGDRVRISAGDEVVIRNTNAIADVVGIDEGGKLSFATDVDTRLQVITLVVLGELEIGTVQTPINSSVTSGITFRDVSIDLNVDPAQYGNGLLALHNSKVRVHGRTLDETFIRLSEEPKAGDTTLVLSEAPVGWQVGDQILLPDSRNLAWNEKPQQGNYTPQWEELTISNIQGNVVTINTPLQFDHDGARDGDGNLDFLPHIANRSRNVVFQSSNSSGTRGHTLFQGRSDIDIRYAAFRDLGRTRNVLLDSTTFDANGAATHIGTNQIARYAIHTHHLVGPTTPQSNGYQYTLLGNVVDNGSQDSAFKWGITIHGSHYGLIKQNVVYNVAGAAIVTEDGSESFNVFDKNFVMRSRSVGSGWRFSTEGSSSNVTGREATGFWFRGPNNYVRNNVATNVMAYDQLVTGFGYKYLLYQISSKMVPDFQGAMPMMNGTMVDMNTVPILEFDNNEVYGATESGMTYWWIGNKGASEMEGIGQSTISDFRIWHTFNAGLYHYPSTNLVVDGLVIRGNPSGNSSVGIDFVDYKATNIKIVNADIQGIKQGIILPQFANGNTLIEDSYLRNYQHNIRNKPHFSVNGSAGHPPKSTTLRNVRFDTWPGSDTINIDMGFSLSTNHNYIQKDELFVEDYNGVQGDDFQVYYVQQAPDYIVPQTGSLSGLIGSPDAGLTNQQNWNTHGIAIAGAVSPTTATRAGINGFVRAISNGENHPPIAANDTKSIVEDAVPNTVQGNVLTNDTDEDGDALTITKVNSSAANIGSVVNGNYGQFALSSSGTYTYSLDNSNVSVDALNAGQNLVDQFTYEISDGEFQSLATVIITINGTTDAPVNSAPVGTNDAGTILEDAIPNVVSGNVLTNDSDIDGDALTVTQVNGNSSNVGVSYSGQYGTLQLNSNGSYTYSLNNTNPTVNGLNAGQSLTDQFNYTLSDGELQDTANLTITINGANDAPNNSAPSGTNDTGSILEDANPNIVIGNVLINDNDIDGDALTVTEVNGNSNNVGVNYSGQYGTLQLNSNGSYSYSVNNANPTVDGLNAGQSLTDQFSYTVSDGQLQDTANLTITINGANDTPNNTAPSGTNDTASILEDAVPNVVSGNVLTNDNDVDGDALTVSEVDGASNRVGNSAFGEFGTLVLNSNGSFTYTLNNSNLFVNALNSGQSLTDQFAYTLFDGSLQDTATLSITIDGVDDDPENSAPNGTNDSAIINENSSQVAGDVLSNDFDVDGDSISVVAVNGNPNSLGVNLQGSYGSLQLEETGDYVYTLDNNNAAVDALGLGQSLTDQFSYTISDGSLQDTATLQVTINGIDDGNGDITNVGESGIATSSQAGPNAWHEVQFRRSYINPVVVVGPATRSDADRTTIRVKNVTENGFLWQIDEWDYLNGIHQTETVGYVVVEAGIHNINGTKIEAGNAQVNHLQSSVGLSGFNATPTVVASVNSRVGKSAVVTRISGVTPNGFSIKLQEEEANNPKHAMETVGYIALDSATGSLANLNFASGTTELAVTHQGHNIGFGGQFTEAPVFLANLTSVIGDDPAGVRIIYNAPNQARVFVEEEQSATAEISHTAEKVAFLAIEPGLIGGVADTNSAPTISDQTFSIDDAAVLNDTVGDVTASDPDGDAITYSFAQANSVFAIDGQTGHLTVANPGNLVVGTETFSIVVADSLGASSSATITVHIADSNAANAIGEVGNTSASQASRNQWHRVDLQRSYENPIVVMGPLSTNGFEPANARIRSVTSDSFEWKISEWDYQNGKHGVESVSYLVIEAGSHSLASGTKIIAGSKRSNHIFRPVSFETSLNSVPAVLATVASNVGSSAVVPRINQVQSTGFKLKVQEEEANYPKHAFETVNYVAIEHGAGTIGGLPFESGNTGNNVNHKLHHLAFSQTFNVTPAFFASIQTRNDQETVAVRMTSIDGDGAQIFAQEEKSADNEKKHGKEDVGFLAIEPGLINGVGGVLGIKRRPLIDVAVFDQASSQTVIDENLFHFDSEQKLETKKRYAEPQVLTTSIFGPLPETTGAVDAAFQEFGKELD